jgi:diguanylate cyclase (GGDEF)-like protein/PAS domain S-box-containing protein
MLQPVSAAARLLLIDDAALVHGVLSLLLQEAETGHTLDWRSTYAEGLEALRTGNYDLCFLDYGLGQLSGLDLLKQAVAEGVRTGVVMLTGQGNRELDHEAMSLGAIDYLEKSHVFSANDFERMVRYLVERQRALEKLRNSEERYSLAVRGANDGIFDWLVGDENAHLSPRFKAILGYDDVELPNRIEAWQSRIHPDDLPGVKAKLDAHVQGQTDYLEHEHRLQHKDGTFRHVLVKGQAVRDKTGRARRLAGSFTDVTVSRAHDVLTGLPNRVLYLDRIEMAFHRSRRDPGFTFALLFVDLDRFKSVNDSLGHSAGDELLLQLSQRLVGCVRLVDTVARLGGDEFTVLLEDPREPDGPARVASRMLEVLKAPFKLRSGHEVFSSASIGIVHSSSTYTHPDELLRDADTAMYEAKAAGRGQYVVFDPTMRQRAMHVLSVESGLRHAIDESQLVTFYQPVVALESRRIVGFEALVRWQHPTRGLLAPSEFIGIAEDTRLITAIDLIVMRQACAQLAAWRQVPGYGELSISLNASRAQFSRAVFPSELGQIIENAKVPARAVRLEVTESVAMGERSLVLPQLNRLEEMGVQLFIDDFGVGYASLSVLQEFPFRGLKVDRSFVSKLETAPRHVGIVRALMHLSRALELTVVAEGIETEGQLRALMELGCTLGQGYLLSRPVTAEAATALLRGA